MKSTLAIALVAVVLGGAAAGSAVAQDPVYREQNEYPVLDEIRAARAARAAARDSVRQAVEAEWEARAEADEEAARDLRPDWSDVDRPSDPAEFASVWFTPPVPQYYTGTCWAFCSVSFLETEAHRLHGREIKLSEMWIVYWEFVEKARGYLRSFGHTTLAQGGQDHGTFEVFRLYGVVPATAYPGVLTDDGRYDHTPLMAELRGYLDWVLARDAWEDEEQVMAAVRGILDRHMGPPPAAVEWEGKSYTPRAFADEVVALEMDDYVSCVSTLAAPFGTHMVLDVEDNWRRRDDYLNLPLDEFYRVVKESVKDGYGVIFGGDNSEAGMDGLHDVGAIPPWDIPADAIDQASREFRIDNGTTSDDHGVHVVGYKRHGGQDWFLTKDSNRSSRLGRFKGHYFWTGDYIRLKALAITVHKDRLEGKLD